MAEPSGFDTKNPNGPWQLRVVDYLDGCSGQFAGGWDVKIKASDRDFGLYILKYTGN